jgi:hypothetical protein
MDGGSPLDKQKLALPFMKFQLQPADADARTCHSLDMLCIALD